MPRSRRIDHDAHVAASFADAAEAPNGLGMTNLATYIGVAAAVCTTTSYVPQVLKTWRSRETADLSRRMLLLLALGVALWCAYGFLLGDVVIVTANAASLSLIAVLIYWKLRIA